MEKLSLKRIAYCKKILTESELVKFIQFTQNKVNLFWICMENVLYDKN